jgi:hypothetical protein
MVVASTTGKTAGTTGTSVGIVGAGKQVEEVVSIGWDGWVIAAVGSGLIAGGDVGGLAAGLRGIGVVGLSNAELAVTISCWMAWAVDLGRVEAILFEAIGS